MFSCSQQTISRYLKEFVDAVVQLKGVYITLPDENEMQSTSVQMKDRFKLENFAYAIDGMMAVFRENA